MVKNPPANAGYTGYMGLIPESGRSPGGGNGNPLWYSYMGNPTDRGVWQATASRGSQRAKHNENACMHTRSVWACMLEKVSFGQNIYVISETVREASPAGISGQGYVAD